MDFDNLTSENTVLNIVKEKFRHDESVISVRFMWFFFIEQEKHYFMFESC